MKMYKQYADDSLYKDYSQRTINVAGISGMKTYSKPDSIINTEDELPLQPVVLKIPSVNVFERKRNQNSIV